MEEIEKINRKIKQYPAELWSLLFLPEEDPKILSVFNNHNINDLEIIASISNGVKLVAVDVLSKTGFYDLIRFRLNDDENLAKIVFGEIDSKILVPNNFIGLLDDQTNATEKKEGDDDNNKIETAEDILKEIENPTPAPSSIPVVQQNEVLIETTKPTTESSSTPSANLAPTPTQTNTPTPEAPANLQNPALTTNKETQLDSKLTENVANPAKSTYYKVDPYREQF